ncbi:phytochrome C [Pyrus ussuriensis x Pyrus communis]|uniref:Phytochrome C n=1 Tax=Pyrus ussuriensis x Pyrus communis TaxID=2448454 RepID=A0A5N5G5N0_9ROSA|nr:phytochrome C [Pyrus ussuriensis x Pyrus communis]
MSSVSLNKMNSSRSSSSQSKPGVRVFSQTPIDAKLDIDFQESERCFDYSASVDCNKSSSTNNVPPTTVSAISEICSEEALFNHLPSLGKLNLLNSILVHSRTSGKPFYAILHRVDVGLVIDLEPLSPSDVPVTAAGALKSYKLPAKAISNLQSLPRGNLSLLCDVIVKEVSDLTGYDRIMVYKFHEDEHGEVIAECHRPDLEPYLGLHFPATDVPQASRFLFMRNKGRMICDCLAATVRVIQEKKLAQPLSLCGSTLRFPLGSHAQYMESMGSIASLVMFVTIKDNVYEMDMVCHHTSPRFVPFPLRYTCEFLIQVFGVQISKEVELAAQSREKHILKTQTLLCDMLMRDSPVGIVTQSPNVMDLVKNYGYLGLSPTEAQIEDIAEWLLNYHSGSTCLSTDSLMEAGYLGASALGNEVCAFRSHTAKEIKWGGAKHDPDDKDDGRKMHPRSSFKAFLEVVKWRSVPREDIEMDVIHSLQLILRVSLPDKPVDDSKVIVKAPSVDDRIERSAVVPIFAVDASGTINGWNMKASELTGLAAEQAIGMRLVDIDGDDSIEVKKNMEFKLKTFGKQENNSFVILVVDSCCSRDIKENVVGVCFVCQDFTRENPASALPSICDYVGIVRRPSALIPPIFLTDENIRCLEWNDAMQNLSGLRREEAVGRMLIGEVFTVKNFGCRLNILLNGVIIGEEVCKLLFGFYNQQDNYVKALLSANKRIDRVGRITGVLCFLHVTKTIKRPPSGIMLMHNLMGSSDVNEGYLRRLCQDQLAKIVDDTDLEGIKECYMEINSIEFNLGETVEVVVNQVMIEWHPCSCTETISRLQQVLSDFLTNSLLFTPASEGSSIVFRLSPKKERIGMTMHIVHLEFG